MSVQKAIFPGLIFGIVCLISLTSWLVASPGRMSAKAVAAPVAQSAAVNQPTTKNEDKGECSVSSSYPESIRQWCSSIEKYAEENGLDPNLVSAVMLQESAGQPDAYSKSGAVGLLQVMPRDGKAANFMCANGPCFTDRPSMEELFNPEYNISYGTRMLSGLIQRTGDIREALKSYGPHDVGYYYADIILGIFNNHQ